MTPDLMTVLGIGLSAGIVSGFFGIGGGTLIVPALVLLLGLPIHVAVGTSLAALLPPVGLLGAWKYYQEGQLNITYALLLGIGLMLGVYLGAEVAVHISGPNLRRAFAIFLIVLSIRLLV
jgi:uncharacterized membrane protein YfcA